MTFNSWEFFGFFAIVIALYYRFDLKGQNRLMVIAGSIFYGAFDVRFLGLLYFSALVDYSVGRGLGRTDDPGRRKLLISISLVSQLGILGFFKYFNFFSKSAANLLSAFGLHADPFTLKILLPVGVSFYTFQTLAYIFAVYRKQVEPEKDLVTFATYVSWFPQLVAGPIERATSLLPQLRRRRTPPPARVAESGSMLILRGLVKKVVIADGVAAYVAAVYGRPAVFDWKTLALGTVGFAVQVYGDFSGYSDIARGLSRLLGVELRRNFEQPFLSRDMREFWQRWHTSLGSWFVDFVSPALGGNRRGPRRALLTVLIIFTLIGLWHGAAWNFVFWGFLNGVFVVIWRILPTPQGRHPMKLRFGEIPRIAFTFLLFCAGVVFFRANSFHDAGVIFKRVLSLHGGAHPQVTGDLVPVMLALVIILDLAERRRRIATIESLRVRMNLGGVATIGEAAAESPIFEWNVVTAGIAVGLALLALVVFSGGTPTPFIYFHF